MKIKFETRGSKEGFCNICGVYGALTRDHTPPKGVYKPRAVEIYKIKEVISPERPKTKGVKSQDGIKYRTLCSDCNNRILGIECDPDLIEFTLKLKDIFLSNLLLPEFICIRSKPQKIMRSILGHLAAIGVNRSLDGEVTNKIKDYILNFENTLPQDISIYLWPYISSRVVLIRAYYELFWGKGELWVKFKDVS